MTFSVRNSSMRTTSGYLCVRLSSVVVVLAATMVLSHPLSAQQLNVQNVVRDYGYIPMTDGVELGYVVYRPTKEGRYPILLEYSPYNVDGNELDKDDAQGKITEFLERGYAYAGVAIRGASCSQGELSMFDSIIADDGKQVVEWLATQPWSTGAVGMIGISYPGHTQIFTAAKRPKGLKAITPYAVTASAYREVWRPGGIFAVNFIGGWAYPQLAPPELRPAGNGATRNATWRKPEGVPRPRLMKCCSMSCTMNGGRRAIWKPM